MHNLLITKALRFNRPTIKTIKTMVPKETLENTDLTSKTREDSMQITRELQATPCSKRRLTRALETVRLRTASRRKLTRLCRRPALKQRTTIRTTETLQRTEWMALKAKARLAKVIRILKMLQSGTLIRTLPWVNRLTKTFNLLKCRHSCSERIPRC